MDDVKHMQEKWRW